MEGFDREALVKSTEAKQKSGGVFWSSVAALPVAGIAAGLFMMGTGSPSAPDAAQPVTAEAAKPQMVAMAQPDTAPETPPDFSATAQLQTYAMTVTTLRACAETGPADHYDKARDTYYDRNFEKTSALRDLAVEETRHDLSAFEKDISTNPAEIMVQGMTGQIAVNALQRQAQFTAMMKDMESDARRVGYGYLGKTPDAVACTNFRNDLIRGKYDIELPPKG